MTEIKLKDDNSGEFIVLDIDEETHSLVTISEPHAILHQGKMYSVSYYDEAVADDANLNIQILTGDKEAHASYIITAGGDAIVEMRESIESTGGTPISIYNKNRNSLNTPLSTVMYNPTVTSSGTLLFKEFTIGGTYNQAIGGGTRTDTEWELLPNTKYLFKTTNKAGLAKVISVSLEFYEI